MATCLTCIKYICIITVVILLQSSSLSIYAQKTPDLINNIKLQYSLQNYISCIEFCNTLEKTDPKNKLSYYYKGLSEYLLGDFNGAMADMVLAGKKNLTLNRDRITKYLIDIYYKGQKVYPELGLRPRYTLKDSLRGSLRPERTCFDVTFYNLSVKINPQLKSISGTSEITFRVVSATKKIQIDLFDNYLIHQIISNDKKLDYKRIYNAIFIEFPDTLPKGSIQKVSIEYSGKPRQAPRPPWDGGFVWKKDKYKNWWCGVACEQFGASSWWPNKDHPSDEPDSALLTFTVPSGYDLVSNGRLRSVKPAGNNYTSFTWFVANPINNYDITFYLGKYAHFSDTITNKKGKYPLDFYVLPYNLTIAEKTFEQAKEVLKFYEQAFGEFPFMNDKYCLVEAPYEGMEHQGAIAYGNNYNKTNLSYIDKKDDYIIVHESAHEWWGNSVTAADMADIWLQEGFATYSELLFLEHKYGYDEYLKQLSNKISEIFNIWPVVQNYGVNENAFASNDCYNKGAAVLNNLRSIIDNDSLFFKLLKDFAEKYEKKIVTTADFIGMANKLTGKNLSPFFKKFLYETSLPVLSYSYKIEGKDLVFSYKWSQVDPGFEMPFCINVNNKCIRFNGTTQQQTIRLNGTDTFRFYNQWTGPGNVDHNGFTLFWTKCEN